MSASAHRRSIPFAVLVALLALTSVLAAAYYARRGTEGQQIVRQAPQRAEANADVAGPLGTPALKAVLPPARWSGNFPCVTAGPGTAPRVRDCVPHLPIDAMKSGPLDRFEVDLRFGKFILRQTDLLLRDGDLEVPLTRTYTSQFWIHRSRVHAFGRNSTHDWDIAPIGSRNPYLDLLIVLPDGDFLHLARISRGSGYADAVYRHSETASRFYAALISWAGDGWDTLLGDGTRIRFPESYHAKSMAQGAPTQVVDRNGNTVQLVRDPQRNLKAIRTPRGHWIKLLHDDRGRIVRAEDHEQRWVTYAYSPQGMLTDVRHSDGRARQYTYAGDRLTWVQDEAGRVLIRNAYRDFMVERQDYANGDSYRFAYRMAANGAYAEDATVVLPDGSTRTVHPANLVPQYVKDIKR